MITRRQVIIVLLLALLFPLLYGGYRRYRPRDCSIPSRSSSSTTHTNFPAGPYYLQTDPAWGSDVIGGSGEPLSAVGCAVCCVSMAFAQAGVDLDPKRLNAELRKRGGYTSKGWLKWEVAAALASNGLAFDIPERPTHAAIDDAVSAGRPVLARILLWDAVPHWVLVVGREQGEYLVKNPLCKDRKIQRLGELSGKIEAIRIVRRSGEKP